MLSFDLGKMASPAAYVNLITSFQLVLVHETFLEVFGPNWIADDLPSESHKNYWLTLVKGS